MKYFLIAGEKSGDIHGAQLIKALVKLDPKAEIFAWGGEHMRNAGAVLLKSLEQLNFMGFIEVLAHLRTIIRNFKEVKQQISRLQPDVIILIDFPGFNLKLAKWLKQNHFKVVYYILPQVWAWKKNRMYALQANADLLLSILPFEKEFYEVHGIRVEYIGHPLVEELEESKRHIIPLILEKPILAIFPGSRKQEIKRLLPIMLKAARKFKNEFSIFIAGVSHLRSNLYREVAADEHIIWDNSHQLLFSASAAIVKSGTSTLEAALCRVPQVICYKASWFSYFIARTVVSKNIRFISLVNLILNKQVCPELIQHKCSPSNIETELKKILENKELILKDYAKLNELLHETSASTKAAHLILNHIPSSI